MSSGPDVATESPRRQARSDRVRSKLIEAALREFAAHGFAAASTRAIAAEAGTQQPQINYHFASKQALWEASVDHLFARLDASISRRMAGCPEAVDDRGEFARELRAFVGAVAELPELNRIMVHEATATSDRLRWIVERHVRPRFDHVTRGWGRLRSAGAVADIDDTVLYYCLVGAASLAYVNAPEAELLGHDTTSAEFVAAHADALVAMVLGSGRARHA